MRIEWLLAVAMLWGCQNFDYSGKGQDVPTAGKVILGVDFADSLLMSEEIDAFQADYPKATLVLKPMCEMELLRQLQMDSIRFVAMNRDFTKEEKDNLENRDIKVRSTRIAETSIAIVVGREAKIDSISIEDLKSLLSGTGKLPVTELVFDGSCGSNYNYIHRQLGVKPSANVKPRFYSNPEKLIQYISTHPDAIGFAGLNLIADKTDSLSLKYGSQVKVLKVENVKLHRFCYPYQSQIRTREYPFCQSLYLHDLQGYNGLAKGFIAYVSSQPGQILVKKSGLLPALDHGRTILIETE